MAGAERVPVLGRHSVTALGYSNAQTALYYPTYSATTGQRNGSLQSAITGNSFASFYLGQVNNSSFSQIPFTDTGARMTNLSIYAQDDIRVNPKITVNLGLRWDYYPPYVEAQNRSTWFSPSVTNPLTGNAGALVFAGHGPNPTYCGCSTPINLWYKNFGPRLGVAYNVFPNTVLRAGFAITYSHGTGVRNATYLGTESLDWAPPHLCLLQRRRCRLPARQWHPRLHPSSYHQRQLRDV